MIGPMLAALLLAGQPAPDEALYDPDAVATEAEVQAEVDAAAVAEGAAEQAEAAAARAEDAAVIAAEQAEVAAEASAVQAEEAADAVTAQAEPEEEIVCRRRLRATERVGARYRIVRDCRPRSEWGPSRRGD
jgi:hypothetical protein